MTLTDFEVSENEIKRYLFAEVSEDERETIEEQFFVNDDLFYEIVDLENQLIDRYSQGKLEGEDLKRFESSLEKLPERRQKVANAVALQTFIAEERPVEESLAEAAGQSVWQKLAEFFTVRTPAFSYTVTGLLVLFTFSSVFLYIDNRRQANQLARLQEQQANGDLLRERQNELESELSSAREQFETERETSGELTSELIDRRQRIEQLERELEKLRREVNAARPAPPPSSAPMIATLFLSPGAITRGGQGTDIKKLDIGQNTEKVSILLALPEKADVKERFSVQLNDKITAQNLKARITRNGQKSVQLTVSAKELMAGANKITIINAAGTEVGKYYFSVNKK